MRAPRSLRWRITLAYTLLIVVAMGAVSLYLVPFVRGSYISDLELRLAQEAGLVGETTARFLVDPEGARGLTDTTGRIGTMIDSRVTIIALDGTVLADTWEDPAAMENHLRRPEVREALNAGQGTSTRFSGTVQREMFYTAVPIVATGRTVGVARVAVPTSQIQANVNRIVAAIGLAGLAVTGLSIALGHYLAGRTARSVQGVTEGARRLASGDLEHRVSALAGDETQDLASAFNSMATTLRDLVQSLSGERNKLSAVLETMTDGVVLIGADGEVALMNRAARDLLDVRLPEGQGSRFMELVRDHELQGAVSRCSASGEQQLAELELLQPRRLLSAIATPLTGPGAEGVLLTLHDLTQRRQVETTRRDFVANVSHELRTPLAAMKAMVETLQHGVRGEPDVAEDFLRRIHSEIDRLSRMADELLELARIESGQVPFHFLPMDLGPVVEAVAGDLRTDFSAQGIALETDLPEDLPAVVGDGERLRQVLVNLLNNAARFTPSGGSVTVSAGTAGRFVEVRVRDTGAGIPREHLPHLFERFYKVDRARQGDGTGLGLAIVKHLVQEHGGDVGVESREGEGSAFRFTLRRAT